MSSHNKLKILNLISKNIEGELDIRKVNYELGVIDEINCSNNK